MQVPLSQLSKILNLKPRRIQQLASEGIIPKAARGAYPLLPCIQGYIIYLQERSEGKGIQAQDEHLHRARLLKAQADKVEIEVATLKGHLLATDKLETIWTDMIMAFRARLLDMPTALSHELAALRKPDAIAQRLKHGLWQALEELSSWQPDITGYPHDDNSPASADDAHDGEAETTT